jgi:CLIP-associating protein 1/2
MAFLTPGGLFERLGDNREKPRDKARESLVLLGGYAFKLGGGSAFASKSTSSKGPETPLAIFERFVKESGFGSKVWRIREQVRFTHPPDSPSARANHCEPNISHLYRGTPCHSRERKRP